MAVSVKPITLWRSEIENRPGTLAGVLEGALGADLQVMMAYRYPGNESKGAVEVYPITGKKAAKAAQSTGLSASSIPAILISGDNKPGLAYAVAKLLADSGINLAFLVGNVIGRKFSMVLGFDTPDDARKAAPLIRKAGSGKR